MRVTTTSVAGVLVLEPEPHHDERGFFTRTLDARVLRSAGVDPAGFIQESQSRSLGGVVRGMHGRVGDGEAKLVRCAHGAVFDVIVDARTGSATFGTVLTFRLDDVSHRHVYVPRGFLHGFQALTAVTDVCYHIDAEHSPEHDVTIRFDDPDLAIPWPLPVTRVSERDRQGRAWADFRRS